MNSAWPPARPSLPAWVGAAALVLAGWLALWATPRWQAEAEQATADLRQRARATAVAAAPVPLRSSADAQLLQALPPAAQLPQRVSALVQLAQQQGLRLDSVRQQPAQRLGSATATLDAEGVPLRLAGSGPYSAWRHLVAEALQQDDALVLAELRLSRGKPTDRMVAGTLQWNLLQRLSDAASAGAAP